MVNEIICFRAQCLRPTTALQGDCVYVMTETARRVCWGAAPGKVMTSGEQRQSKKQAQRHLERDWGDAETCHHRAGLLSSLKKRCSSDYGNVYRYLSIWFKPLGSADNQGRVANAIRYLRADMQFCRVPNIPKEPGIGYIDSQGKVIGKQPG